MRLIAGFQTYFVTESGQVWSAPKQNNYKTGRWLKHAVSPAGYHSVRLAGFSFLVHRLVLEAFVGPCPEGMEGCHNNGDPADNRLANLRWDTKSANAKDSIRHGTHAGCTRGELHSSAKLTEQQVRHIIYTYRTGVLTRREISQQYGVCRRTVDKIVNRQTWDHVWRGLVC